MATSSWTTSKQCKVPTKQDQRLDHATKLEEKPLSPEDLFVSLVSQHCALREHSCRSLCPLSSEIIIAAEMKVSQCWAHCDSNPASLSLHLVLSFHFTVRNRELSHDKLWLFSGRVIGGDATVPEASAQSDNVR